MSKQQTYKAKGTGLFALLIVLFAGMGGKTCKNVRVQPQAKTAQADSTIPTPTSSTPVPDTPKVAQAADTPVVAPAATPRVVSARPVTDSIRRENLLTGEDTLRKQPVLKLQSFPAEAEILALSGEPDSALIAAGGSDSLSSTTAGTENPADNSGSSYFTSQIQTQMNDQIKAVYTTKLLYDSVVVTNNKEFVYNTLTLNNTTANPIEIQVFIFSPPGWQMVTTNNITIALEPYASTIIPMRFSASGSHTAFWQQVRIEYRINNVIDSRKSAFKMRVQEYTGFKGSLPNSAMVLSAYQKNLAIPVYVKNSGNTPGTYSITASNQLLKLDAKMNLQLQPGRDTIVYINNNVSEAQFSMLRKEEVRVGLANEKGETISMIQLISKIGSVLHDHSTAYLEMPLQLELGTIVQGNGAPTQYYGALNGSVNFDEYRRASFSLRSNTIASGQRNDNSIVRVDYESEQFQASIGNVQGLGDFIVDGYGARMAYKWKGFNKAEAFGTFRSRVGDTKVFGGAVQLAVRPNLRISDVASVSLDNVGLRDNGIISQVTEYQFSNGKIALITGFGGEQNKGVLKEGERNTLTGTSLGYNLQWENKYLLAMSNVLYNSNSYPGLFRGQRLQLHDVRAVYRNFFLGGYYEYNFRKQDFFLDTTIFTNVFNLKTTNVGARGGWSFKGGSVIVAAGNQKQLQEGEDNFPVNFNYINFTFSTLIAKRLYVNIVSFAGIQSAAEGEKGRDVFASTSQGSIQYKSVGASFRYDQGPYYYQDYIKYTATPQKYERILFSPFVQVQLFKSSFNARLQGNYAQTLPGDFTNTNILGNINYSNYSKGFDFNINGILPIGNETNSSYLSAAFRMRIKAPFVAVRKYYNLKLVLFRDENGNSTKDAGEATVPGQTLSLNGDLFVSDSEGIVWYKNTEKGIYKADFGYSSKLKGWMPSGGTTQNYEVSGNRTIEVPYKISRLLQGYLRVEKDSLSNITFNPHNIKVTATGTKGEVFATLTDENGEFYFNLPTGIYIISLAESAFSEQFRPVQFSQQADLVNNQTKTVYFDVKQKKRQMNIKKK